MSKNKYRLPFNGSWYIEFGGTKRKNSHSYDIIAQRYAYDFEIRKDNVPFHDDSTNINNHYSYLQDIICPLDGFVIDLRNEYINTRITNPRTIINDCPDPRGNYITIKHPHGEYSTICHFEKDSFKVKLGDIVTEGQVLGKVGNSGNTLGPHIHFQVQSGNDFINSPGIIITFKNTYNNKKKVNHLQAGMTPHNK